MVDKHGGRPNDTISWQAEESTANGNNIFICRNFHANKKKVISVLGPLNSSRIMTNKNVHDNYTFCCD